MFIIAAPQSAFENYRSEFSDTLWHFKKNSRDIQLIFKPECSGYFNYKNFMPYTFGVLDLLSVILFLYYLQEYFSF